MNGEELTFKVNIEAGDTAQIEIIEPQALANLVEANQEVKRLTDEINKLKAAEKEQGQLTAEQQQEMEKLNAELKQARTNYQNQQKDLNALTSAQKASGQSYNELVAQNKALSIAMRQLPLDDTTGKLQKLQQQYNQNNDRLKQFDATMGNHQRNVGNYPKLMGGIGSAFQSLPGPIGNASNAFTAFGKTLLANPIGIIVTLFGLLVNQIMKLNPVMEKLQQITAVLNTTFAYVTDAVYNFITGQEQNQRSLKETIKLQWELTAAIDAHEDAIGDFEISQANANKQIAQYMRLAKDSTKPIYERIDAVNKAMDLEEDRATEEFLRIKRSNKLLEDQLKLTSSTDDQLNELRKKKAEGIKAETEMEERLTTLTKTRNKLIKEIQGEQEEANKKAQEAAKKRKEDLEKEIELVNKLNSDMKELSLTLINDYLSRQEKIKQEQINLLNEIDTLGKKIDDNFKKRRQDLDKFNQNKDEAILNYELAQLNIRYTQREQLEIDYRKRILELQKHYINLGIEANYAAEMAKFEANKEFAGKGTDLILRNLKFIADSAVAINNALFKESKALAIAQAIIDTLAASVSVLRSEGPLWKRIASSAVILAQGYATVQKIRSTNKGTSSTGSTSIPTPAPSAGRMPMVGNAFNPGAPMTMGNANLSAGMAGAMGSRDMGITVNAKVDRKGLAIAVREGEREIKTQQFTFA
jgi:DNA repair exonuclease SbcCD ATPase subunit